MKTMTRVLSVVLVLCMVALAGCTPAVPTVPTTTAPSGSVNTPSSSQTLVDLLTYAEGTELRMATGYNSNATGMFFHADQFKDYPEGITLANGQTYFSGDLKPTWVEVENRLKLKFINKYTGKSASNTFKEFAEKLGEVDMVSGTATQLTEYGQTGAVVNIAEHLDKMPNFKAYLDANPIVRLSITGNTDTGAIYFSPYFDGVNDIERMPLMRTDWVVKLLDGEGEFSAEKSGNLKPAAYEPYMPLEGKVDIEVVKKDGTAVETISKDYTKAGNIVALMNAELAKGTVTGVQAVNMLRKYIDEAYNGYYGNTRSDLFVGQNAAWDADELVALLRCVVANAQTLNGTDTVYGLFSREDGNNQRRVDMFRFCGTLFGVRGLESRQDYLYVGTDGKLHDARMEADTYEALERLNNMASEGLISQSFMDHDTAGKTQTMLEKDLGFMHYDYNQTQTLYNQEKLDNAAGEKYMAVMVPVARWYDGTNANGVYMRFTESWRSVKTDGWAISVAGINGDQDKLNACLKLIDYAYSPEGQILMSYGPDEFIAKNADGSYKTFNFNGTQMPVIHENTYAELWSLAKGNYTNYARQFLGSTLSFVKSQAFEYQCTHEVGREGAGHISTAIGLGTIKHPELAVADNAWYTSVPTVLPTTKVENDEINTYTDLTKKFSTSKDAEGATQTNYLLDIIVGGYAKLGLDGVSSAEAMADYVANNIGGKVVLDLRQGAYETLLDYYEDLNG